MSGAETTSLSSASDASVGPTAPIASSPTIRKYESPRQRGQQHQVQQQRNLSGSPRCNKNNNTPRSKNQWRQRRNKDPSVSPSPRKHQQEHQPIPQVFASSNKTFADFYNASSRASRYKVHKPGCSCSKIASLKSRLVTSDGSLANQMNQLSVNDEEKKDDTSMDGLIVLPDTKLIRTIYKCCDTPLASFDRIKDELKLRAEMFNDDKMGDDMRFKVSCAQCLLLEEPNGFACVASSDKEQVLRVKELAMAHQESKQGVLHADHAHFVAVLSQEALSQQNPRRSNSRSPAWKAQPPGASAPSSPSMIVQELQQQGILHPDDEEEKTGNETKSVGPTISFGHHLKSVLGLKRKGTANKEDSAQSTSYWLVLGYKDPDNVWALDLPGGKRHLGETAIECAIRETEEEVSLIWSNGWIEERSLAKYDKCNMYFFLKQPEEEQALSTKT